MANKPASMMEIQELDAEGQPLARFTCDANMKAIQTQNSQRSSSRKPLAVKDLMDVFLPAGYPSSVTPDYTPYQIYDTLQAFASTIAGLLASRAVFVGMGVGSEDASLVTTMLLYIAQETIGRVATILFAHRFSQRIEAEVKFYRFFADIVNDLAFVLDCLSPGLPVVGRVCTLCVSNACRAVCGVSGGSSKAILSAHFAKAGNIGELNAKDGSQETVVSLIGMWTGGLVVSRVHGTFGTWCCLLPLLVLHLWANWKAVKSVQLTSLNTDRATIVFDALLHSQVKTLTEVAGEESVFRLNKIFPSQSDAFRVSISVTDFLHRLSEDLSSESLKSRYLIQLLEVFREEDYLLWYDIHAKRGTALLKESATSETQAKAICHFLRISNSVPGPVQSMELLQQDQQANPNNVVRSGINAKFGGSDEEIDSRRPTLRDVHGGEYIFDVHGGEYIFDVLSETLHQNQQDWQSLLDKVERAGWDLSLTNLVGGRCNRFRTNEMPLQEKKDR